MRFIGLPAVLSLGAIGAIALLSSPAQAQYVSIPVTNGNFAITNNGGTLQYSTMPTFLSPAGTLTINTADPNFAAFHSLTPITTNTPVGFTDNGSLAGSVSLNDGRTATFTGAGASLRGTATVTGAPSVTLPSTSIFYRLSSPLSSPLFYPTLLPNGATLTYTAQSGAIHIPAVSLGTYSTPQFTIPISGGSFTLIDPTGTGNATVTLNSVLTPLGTTTLTLNAPNLSSSTPVIRFASYFITPTLTVNLGGLANGTVALSDGRTATVTDRLIALKANTQLVAQISTPQYEQGARLLTVPVTIQGAITGGSISVPESAVTPLPVPVQPPAVIMEQQVSPVTPPSKQELALGFAKTVTLQEPFEFINQEQSRDQGKKQVDADDPPEGERSALEFSRIHPGLHGRP